MVTTPDYTACAEQVVTVIGSAVVSMLPALVGAFALLATFRIIKEGPELWRRFAK